jgi:hypothetical protein
MSRFVAFAISSGIERSQAEKARSAIAERLPILSPEDDQKLLREAGLLRPYTAALAWLDGGEGAVRCLGSGEDSWIGL